MKRVGLIGVLGFAACERRVRVGGLLYFLLTRTLAKSKKHSTHKVLKPLLHKQEFLINLVSHRKLFLRLQLDINIFPNVKLLLSPVFVGFLCHAILFPGPLII